MVGSCCRPLDLFDGGAKVSCCADVRAGAQELTQSIRLEGSLAAEARDALDGEAHETAASRCDDSDRSRVVSGDYGWFQVHVSISLAGGMFANPKRRTERAGAFTHDRLEDTHERLGELVLEVVLGVDRDVVLENVERIFGLFIRASILRSLDDDV